MDEVAIWGMVGAGAGLYVGYRVAGWTGAVVGMFLGATSSAAVYDALHPIDPLRV